MNSLFKQPVYSIPVIEFLLGLVLIINFKVLELIHRKFDRSNLPSVIYFYKIQKYVSFQK